MRDDFRTEGKFDLLIVGGGINGAGIACDAAGRGISVLLCEAGDLATATSSASSKLIHGGLRYLEQYQFRMVRESLKEREIILKKAPHIVRPLRFILPHVPSMRQAWILRTGLFLYDHLYHREEIKGSQSIDLTNTAISHPLKNNFRRGFSYWDCWADDARLVVYNAMAAHDKGADIRLYTEVLNGTAGKEGWTVRLKDKTSNIITEVHAKTIVNAAGPWANEVIRRFSTGRIESDYNHEHVRLIKGSHIVVPRLSSADDGFIFQNKDKRIVFVLPFEEAFTIIGTTDTPFKGDPEGAEIDEDEQAYLLDVARLYLKNPPSEKDIVWSFSGVRPLFDSEESSPSKITRDYKIKMTNDAGCPPLLSVLGGKITTYRKLAEYTTDKLAAFFPNMSKAWTAGAKLPGADLEGGSPESHLEALRSNYPKIDNIYLRSLSRRHGSFTSEVLGDTRTMEDLGTSIGGNLYEREAIYLKEREWANLPDDILWRRTKVGVHLSPEDRHKAEETLVEILK